MKKNLMHLIPIATVACSAMGFQIVSSQPNRSLSFDAITIQADAQALSGSGLFKDNLYFGDDEEGGEDPKKPTDEGNQLLAFYGG